MTKKVIIYVLIFLLVINTIYWLYVTIKISKYNEWIESCENRLEWLRSDEEKLPHKKAGIFDVVNVDKLSKEEKNEYERIRKARDRIFEELEKGTSGFTNRMIGTFAESNLYTIPLLILAITDIVLIAISFMIILLYKKD